MAQQNIDIGSSPDDGTGDSVRTAFDKVNDNFDELYSPEDWTDATLLNGWVNQAASGYGNIGFRKDAMGLVYTRGLADGSSKTDDDIYQLPSGYHPASQQIFVVAADSPSGGNYAKVFVRTDGLIRVLYLSGGATNVSLTFPPFFAS